MIVPLHKLELEGFKCFGRRQKIDLEPITLILSPNPSGKSTLLQGLLALCQSLSGLLLRRLACSGR